MNSFPKRLNHIRNEIKYLSLYIIFSTVTPICFGQSAYYQIDSNTYIGITLEGGTDIENAKYCQLVEKNGIKKFTPNEVSSYKFKDGREYFSMEIAVDGTNIQAFLQRLVNDSTSLYYYRAKGIKRYYIATKDSLLIPIQKHVGDSMYYKMVLGNLSEDCESTREIVNDVKFNKNRISDFISRYNTCNQKPYPLFSFGIIAGYDACRMATNSKSNQQYFDQFDYEFKGGVTVGLFIDQPINLSNFSIYADIKYSYHQYSYSNRSENTDMDFLVEMPSINLPLMLRYSWLKSKAKPFVNIGAIYGYNYNVEKTYYSANINESEITLGVPYTETGVNESLLGMAFGFGLNYKIHKEYSIIAELRCNQLYGLEPTTMNQMQIQVLTGIRF